MNQVEIKMEDFKTTITNSRQNLTSHCILQFYKQLCHLDKKNLLFANPPNHNIGNGFISSHLHFAIFQSLGIKERMLVTVRNCNNNHLISGKSMLPQELTNVMNDHTIL